MSKKSEHKKKKTNVDVSKEMARHAAAMQEHIPFAEVRTGLIIMKDGSLRRVIKVSSINFALKSEEEQQGIIQSYVSFLNTIDFELQILIQSRKLNIDRYLHKLEVIARQQDNELLRRQAKSYQSFIARLVQESDIMDKRFYVVVPLQPDQRKKKNFWTRFRDVLAPVSVVKIKQELLDKETLELDRRVSLVTAGLHGVGLEVQTLDTQELIELFYNVYNPQSHEERRIDDIYQLQVDRTIV